MRVFGSQNDGVVSIESPHHFFLKMLTPSLNVPLERCFTNTLNPSKFTLDTSDTLKNSNSWDIFTCCCNVRWFFTNNKEIRLVIQWQTPIIHFQACYDLIALNLNITIVFHCKRIRLYIIHLMTSINNCSPFYTIPHIFIISCYLTSCVYLTSESKFS